jgi:hypothetical protein
MMIDDVRVWLARANGPNNSALVQLNAAPAYEISGVMAFVRHLKKKGKLEEFTVDIDTAFSPGFRWLEGEDQADDGSKKHLGFLVCAAGPRSFICEFEALHNGSFKGAVLLAQNYPESQESTGDESGYGGTETKLERACLYAWLVTYFESNPASATISVKPGRRAKVKKGKELKRALAEMRTIVIDGVEKIFTADGINFRVHARGWHVRRHNVKEHERHYANGKVAIVRAFQRGDINLGFVSHESPAAQSETRFSVQPDKVFFDTEQKAKSASAGK